MFGSQHHMSQTIEKQYLYTNLTLRGGRKRMLHYILRRRNMRIYRTNSSVTTADYHGDASGWFSRRRRSPISGLIWS